MAEDNDDDAVDDALDDADAVKDDGAVVGCLVVEVVITRSGKPGPDAKDLEPVGRPHPE